MGEIREAIGSWAQQAGKNAGLIVVLGVLTATAGFLAMGSPLASGLTVVVFLGIAMTIAGVARTIGAFSAGSFGQGTLAFIGAIITFVAGLMLAARPGIGLEALTLMLRGYLLIDSMSSAILSFRLRPESGWGFMFFSAIVGVLMGFLLLREWPLSGLWAIGTLVGVNLVINGFSLISVGSAARRAARKLA
jgi:uncharacterized membrane protein HdeD (DUF308 family)